MFQSQPQSQSGSGFGQGESIILTQRVGVVQAENESLKARIKLLEDSLNVCFLIFNKMGFSPDELRRDATLL